MTKQIRADLMLLLVAMFWGVSYILTDLCLEYVSPLTLNAYRFLIAFAMAFSISFSKLKKPTRTTIKYSVLLGLALTMVYITYGFGIKYTSLSNAGFLCALPVVFTPVLGFIFKKQIPKKNFIIVVCMSILGIGLLTLNETMTLKVGDILCILCSVFYAVDLLLAETAVGNEDVNAYQVGVYQLGFTGLFTGLLAVAIETPSIPRESEFWYGLLVLAIFCTGLSFIIQILAQQYTTAAHVGVIFTLEPVFAGVIAYFFAGEILTTQAYIGAVILILGLFVMEVDFKKIKKEEITAEEESNP